MLSVITGQTFTRQTIEIDGKRFENCKFIECTIIYGGGPAEAFSCHFSKKTQWGFRAPFGPGMQVLQQFGWRFEYGEPGPHAPVIQVPVPKNLA
jgi:hypothetical protein